MARLPSQIGSAFDSVLGAAQRDAPWAYERLWRGFAPSVLSYLRLQGAAEPEDLTSEVFLGAFRGIGAFQGDEDGFRGWVFTIAHRRLTDARRRASVRPQWAGGGNCTGDGIGDGIGDGEGPLPEEVGGSVEDEAWRRLDEQRVIELCNRLVPAQRDVLLLRLVADLTVDQVAEALGKTPGAVKQLQRRGLVALREILLREGVPL